MYANTFGANELKLEGTGYTVEEIVSQAVLLAKDEAASFGAYAALDIGPIGELLEPMGTLTFERAVEMCIRDRSRPEHEDTCTMCGKMCAVRNMKKILSGQNVDAI